MLKVKLQVLRQINDHDGYCSGNENEYSEEVLIYFVDLPEQYVDSAIGTNLTDFYSRMELSFVAPEIKEDLYPIVNKALGSCYCNIGEEGEKHNLGVHDYRITIINAIVVTV